jgi:thiamine biosynthesis lipoprotein
MTALMRDEAPGDQQLGRGDRVLSRGLRTRREVLRILAVGGAVGGLGGLALLARSRTPLVTRSRVLMGTVVELQVLADDRDEAAGVAQATLDRMAELEGRLSRYLDGSEVSRLNATGRLEAASDALLDVLRLSQRTSRLGDGAFDVSVQPLLDLYRGHLEQGRGLPPPGEVERATSHVDYRALRIEGSSVRLERSGMRITLDGVGKGYVVDRGVAVLRERGFPNVFVEAGGDLVAGGHKDGGRPWRVGIRSPRQGLALQARFDALDRAVATSGDYMQPFARDYGQHHILDPRTGYSAPELASATVVAPDAATADALATLSMVLGPRRGRELLEELPDCEGYLVSKALEVTRTSGFAVV